MSKMSSRSYGMISVRDKMNKMNEMGNQNVVELSTTFSNIVDFF